MTFQLSTDSVNINHYVFRNKLVLYYLPLFPERLLLQLTHENARLKAIHATTEQTWDYCKGAWHPCKHQLCLKFLRGLALASWQIRLHTGFVFTFDASRGKLSLDEVEAESRFLINVRTQFELGRVLTSWRVHYWLVVPLGRGCGRWVRPRR
jgi:hypothetical protein